ncbi:pyrimidine reductase family protein [Streptomyces sp. NPDC048518]|uniref:pyrimidine reductase family protein n=1 Tax=Streptomyces sp. NPDC048518 TaxID=3155029 RepID=UPI0033E0F172
MRRLFPVTDPTADRPDIRAEDRTSDRAPRRQDETTAPERGLHDDRDREWGLDELADAYAYPAGEATWLRANMVSTLDGAAHHDGRSHPISGDTDMRIFGTLRSLADAVIVGAETVRKEGYRPAKARAAFEERRAAAGQSPAPAIVVVSAGLDLDFSLPLFTAPLTPTLLVTGAAAPAERIAAAEKAGAVVLIAGEGATVEPERVAPALAERGLTRLLTEGGPRLLGQFVAAGALDELCLTVSPMLTSGDAQRIAGGSALTVPDRFALTSVLEEAGFLFTRYRRT